MARLVATLAVTAGAAGCMSRAEYLRRDADLRKLVRETQTRVTQLQREVDRMRGESETRPGHRPGTVDPEQRLTEIEQRLAALEGTGQPLPESESGATAPPSGEEPPSPRAAVPSTPPPTPPPAPPVAPVEDEWRRDVSRDAAAAGALNVPEKAEFVSILEGTTKQTCSRSIEQLNAFVAKNKQSPLADNALYWTARCYVAKGDQNQAISKFYEVGTRYPKGDKTPAALWEQANLFIKMGNTPDARIVLSRLTSYYPNTDEAAKARQRLAELGR